MDDLIGLLFAMICAALMLMVGLLALAFMIAVWILSLPLQLSAILWQHGR